MANVKATAETVKDVAAKKAEEAKETVMAAAKAAETKIDEVKAEAKEAAAKAEAEKAAPDKKETAPAKEVKAERKKPGRKPGSKTKTAKAAKKEISQPEIFIQFGPGESSVSAVVERIRNEYVGQGHRVSSIKSLKVYLKPEDSSAYYVINDKVAGRVDLF